MTSDTLDITLTTGETYHIYCDTARILDEILNSTAKFISFQESSMRKLYLSTSAIAEMRLYEEEVE